MFFALKLKPVRLNLQNYLGLLLCLTIISVFNCSCRR